MNALAITGVGMVGPLGVGKKAWVDAIRRGDIDCFEPASTVLEPTKFPEAAIAEAWGFDPKTYLGDKGIRNFDRLTKFLIVAAKFALEDAGIKKDGAFIALSPEQVGVCSATAYGSLDAITEHKLITELEDPRYLNPSRFPNTVINAAAGYVSIWEDLRAPNVTIVDGNCGALDAMLTASTHLEHQRGDAFVVGGGEVLSEALYLAFRKLGVLVDRGGVFAPGHDNSQGLRIGEGSAFLSIERLGDARSRNAHILGVVTGYGTAYESPESEVQLVHVSSHAVKRSMQHALDDAGIEARDVTHVCSSVGGIPMVDAPELGAIHAVFGKSVGVLAPKALFGETFGASGALSLAMLAGLGDDFTGVPMVSGDAARKPKHTVVNTVGYYGNVSSVVLSSATSFAR